MADSKDVLYTLRKHGLPVPESLQSAETPAAWSFKNDAVADKFDAHVREQLPWYEPLSRFVADVAVSFLPRGGTLYDIGASTGNITRLMKDDIDAKCAIVHSIEPSHQMAARFTGVGEPLIIDAERVRFEGKYRPDVVVMFLTLMFMHPLYRTRFLENILEAVNPGGAVVIVDKGYLQTTHAQVACKAAQLADKRRAGTSAESYVTKELSLRGEQRPTDRELIIRLAAGAGFVVEDIFRFGEFYGVLCVKRSI